MSIDALANRIDALAKRIRFLCRSERARKRCEDALALLTLAFDALHDGDEDAASEWLALAN
jgi:hypothetical protein